MTTVSPGTRRPAGKVLVCGPEDGYEAARAAGAARGSGLPPANGCPTEGVRGVWRGGVAAGATELYCWLLVE